MLLLNQSRNVAASGQYKEEMLHQLRELAKLEPDHFNDDLKAFKPPLMGFQSHESEEDFRTADMYLSFEELDIIPSYEVIFSFP